jgi:hypothetical protein
VPKVDFGAYLLDSDGKQIGLRYSSPRTVGVTVGSTQRLASITTDQPWVRDDREVFRRFEYREKTLAIPGAIDDAD